MLLLLFSIIFDLMYTLLLSIKSNTSLIILLLDLVFLNKSNIPKDPTPQTKQCQ
jgi:hypothetical protein